MEQCVGDKTEHYILRAQGLGDDELARLEAFLRIGSERLARPWRLAVDEHFDVLMLGQAETVPMPLADAAGGPFLIRLVDRAHFQGLPAELCLPLSFEALVEELLRLEGRLRTRLPDVVRKNVPVLDKVVTEVPATTMAPRPEPVPVPVPAAWPVLPEDPQRPGVASPRARRRYRVNQAPTLAALGGDRKLMTLASLLLMRAINLGELTLQSGMDAAECERGLARLMALGLLVISDPDAPAARPASARRRTAPEPAPTEADGSVLARWKDLLGMRGRP